MKRRLVLAIAMGLAAGTADARPKAVADAKPKVAADAKSAKPKIAIVPLEGDSDGAAQDAVSDALGDDAEVAGSKTVTRAIDKLGLDTEMSDKDLRRLSGELEVDAIFRGTLTTKDDGIGVLHFKLFVKGKKVKGFTVEFGSLKSSKVKAALHDKLLEKLGVEKKVADDDDDATPKRKRQADDDDATPKKKKKGAAASGDDDEATLKKKKTASADDDSDPPKKKKAAAGDDDDATPRKKKPAASDDDDATPKKKKAAASDDDDATAAKKPASADDDTTAKKKSASDDDDSDASAKKTKRVAKADDEEEDRVEKITTVKLVSPHSASHDAARVDIGVSLLTRNLTFNSRNFDQAPKGYKNSPVPGGRVEAELYPLAFNNPTSAAAGLGIAGSYDQTFTLDLQSAAQPGTKFPVTEKHWDIGLRYRLVFGSKPTSPSVTAGLGYGHWTFTIDEKALMAGNVIDLPGVDYTGYLPGLTFRVPLTRSLALLFGGSALLVTGSGDIQTPTQYGQAKITSGSGMVGLDIMLGNRYAIRVAGEVAQMGFVFTGGAQMTNNRDGDPSSKDVGGATDRYIGGAVTFGYVY
jgi:hypothetical protein